MDTNTTPDYEAYTEADDDNTPLTQEEILMNEEDILQGLLSLGDEINNPENYRTIRIKRGDKVRLTFRVRPITAEESHLCLKKATPMARNKKKKPEPNYTKYQSLVIYTATVDEDRRKIWDNAEALNHMNLMEGWELIDRVIFAGEKSRIMDVIGDISGFEDENEEEETAKNS